MNDAQPKPEPSNVPTVVPAPPVTTPVPGSVMQPTTPTNSDKIHQGVSGILSFIAFSAAVVLHTMKMDDWASAATTIGAMAGSYFGGHMKGSQTTEDPPN